MEMARLAYATRSSYKSYLNAWVKNKMRQHTGNGWQFRRL